MEVALLHTEEGGLARMMYSSSYGTYLENGRVRGEIEVSTPLIARWNRDTQELPKVKIVASLWKFLRNRLPLELNQADTAVRTAAAIRRRGLKRPRDSSWYRRPQYDDVRLLRLSPRQRRRLLKVPEYTL